MVGGRSLINHAVQNREASQLTVSARRAIRHWVSGSTPAMTALGRSVANRNPPGRRGAYLPPIVEAGADGTPDLPDDVRPERREHPVN